jgi:hypothetical protein
VIGGQCLAGVAIDDRDVRKAAHRMGGCRKDEKGRERGGSEDEPAALPGAELQGMEIHGVLLGSG